MKMKMMKMSMMEMLLPAIVVAIVLIGARVETVDASTEAGGHHEENVFLEQIWQERLNLTINATLGYSEFKELIHGLKLGETHTDSCTAAATSHEHSHAGHDHQHRRRRKRSAGHSEEFEKIEKCLNHTEMLSILNITNNNVTASTSGISYEQFGKLAGAIVQQVLGKFCVMTAASKTVTAGDTGLTYLYGSLTVLVISIASLFGCVLATCSSTRYSNDIMLFMIELAVGALLGEAIIHLMPTIVMGSHSHSGIPSEFPRLAAMCGVFWLFHFADCFSTVCSSASGSHSHNISGEVSVSANKYATDPEQEQQQQQQQQQQKNINTVVHEAISFFDLIKEPKKWLKDPYRVCAFVQICDSLHNFADGMAIGAAFTISHTNGLRTGIAVALHEIAHEFADFAILLSAGFSAKAAILMNFVSALTSFIGLYIAIPLSNAVNIVRVWILTITAMLFLYIALVSLFGMIKTTVYTPKNYRALWIGNFGLLVGFGIIIGVSFFEFYF